MCNATDAIANTTVSSSASTNAVGLRNNNKMNRNNNNNSSMMYTKEQMEETWNYLLEEKSCVTARWVCRNFQVSRAVAASILCDILKYNPSEGEGDDENMDGDNAAGGVTFEVTIMKVENNDEDGSKKGEIRWLIVVRLILVNFSIDY